MRQNVATKIDGATGKVTVNPETTFDKVGDNITALDDKPFTSSPYVIGWRNQITPGTDKIGTVPDGR